MLKKLFLIFMIILQINLAHSQCFVIPPCDEIQVSGEVENQNFTGDKVLSGSGIISQSTTFDSWNVLAFKGALVVRPDIVFPDDGNVYASGTVSFKKMVFNNNDTLFINSYTVVENVVNNGIGNVIVLPVHISYILIGFTPVQAGTVYKGIKVTQCGSILPITASKLQVSRIDKNTFRLNLELNETLGDKTKVIRVLKDGKEVWRKNVNGETKISETFKIGEE